jgi:MarR family transcriptional regulator, organic hydroperoxide resistance regulator
MSTRKHRAQLVSSMFQELRRMVANSVLFNLRMAETLKINPTDLQFINLLDIDGPLTPGRLAELTRLTTGGVTVVLDRLEKAGVIRREPNPNDRRSSLVHVVPKFLRSAETAYGKMAEATDTLLAQFSDKELAVVLSFLKKANDTRV